MVQKWMGTLAKCPVPLPSPNGTAILHTVIAPSPTIWVRASKKAAWTLTQHQIHIDSLLLFVHIYRARFTQLLCCVQPISYICWCREQTFLAHIHTNQSGRKKLFATQNRKYICQPETSIIRKETSWEQNGNSLNLKSGELIFLWTVSSTQTAMQIHMKGTLEIHQ